MTITILKSRIPFILSVGILLVLCLGCSLKVQKKALHQPYELAREEGLDGKSPWLKAHLSDGGVYLLSNWHVDETSRVIEGRGILYDARRDSVAGGPFVVPLDSVAIFESNIVHTSSAVAGLSVLSVASLGLTVYCIANPKACFGSCPTFYAADEHGQSLLMAEGFSASVAPNLEDSDLDALFRATGTGGRFTLDMTNEALETHVVRHADLLMVPRPPDGRVMAAQDGTFWEAMNLQSPVRGLGSEGECTELLTACDGRERTSLADSLYLGAKESLDLEFDRIPPGKLGLVVASRHSLLSTYLFYQGLAYLGEQAAPALARLDHAPETQPGSQTLGDLLGRIEVQVPGPDGEWITAGTTGETGPLAVNVHMLRLPDLDPADPRLRLRFTKGNWRLDYVALAVLGDRVWPDRVAPAMVLRNGHPDPDALAKLTSPDRTLITLPGDRYRLVYDLPTAGGQWDVFLESRGYYLEWMREEWLAEEDPVKAALMFRYPRLALSYLAPKFKELEPGMEAHFWGSRYAH
ncbi:MAG: hypothetical protein ABFS42_07090 [Candidatus Krumholzibacteriota bacterium]